MPKTTNKQPSIVYYKVPYKYKGFFPLFIGHVTFFFLFITKFFFFFTCLIVERRLHSIVLNVLDQYIVTGEFELELCNCIKFLTKTFRKNMKPVIPLGYGLNSATVTFSYADSCRKAHNDTDKQTMKTSLKNIPLTLL